MIRLMCVSLALFGTFLFACDPVSDNLVAAPPKPPAGDGTGSGLSFSANILPITTRFCSKCHGSSSPAGGMDATSYDSLIQRIVPGDPDASLLYQRLVAGEMPPPGNPQPSDDEVEAIRQWILDGAPNN